MKPKEPEFPIWRVVGLFILLAVVLSGIGVCMNGCNLLPDPNAPLAEAVEVGAEAPAWSEAQCSEADDWHVALTVIGGVLGGLGAGSSVILAAWPDPPRDAVVGFGVGGAAAGVIGGGIIIGADYLGKLIVERCTIRIVSP